MGFDGTSVTPQIQKLIQEHHLGSILLTAKNLKCEFRARACVKGICVDGLKLRKKPRNLYMSYKQ